MPMGVRLLGTLLVTIICENASCLEADVEMSASLLLSFRFR